MSAQAPIRMIGWNKRFVFMMAISRLRCGLGDEAEQEMEGLDVIFLPLPALVRGAHQTG